MQCRQHVEGVPGLGGGARRDLVTGTGADFLLVVALVTSLGLEPWLATVLGCALGAVVNFLMNRMWTFGSTAPPLGQASRYALVSVTSALLNGDHWLVRWASARLETDPQALAALLLACYAHINAILEPVTNTHEQLFQRRLAAALEAGEL